MADDYTGMLRLLEAECCFRKPEVMRELGWEYSPEDDHFLSGMNLQDLVQLRAGVSHCGSSCDMFASWHRRARGEGVL